MIGADGKESDAVDFRPIRKGRTSSRLIAHGLPNGGFLRVRHLHCFASEDRKFRRNRSKFGLAEIPVARQFHEMRHGFLPHYIFKIRAACISFLVGFA